MGCLTFIFMIPLELGGVLMVYVFLRLLGLSWAIGCINIQLWASAY